MARNSIAKKVVREDGTGIDFNFANGKSVDFNYAKIADIPAALLAFCRENPLHAVTRGLGNGFSQKIGDDWAGVADVEEAIEGCESMIERLYGGEWSAEREPAGPRPSLVADAVIMTLRDNGLTFDEAKTRAKYIGKDGADERKKALANKKVQANYDKIRAERLVAKAAESAAAAANASADLGGLA